MSSRIHGVASMRILTLLLTTLSLISAAEAPSNDTLSAIWDWIETYGPSIITLIVGLLLWSLLRAMMQAIFKRTQMVPEVQRMAFKGLRWIMITLIILVAIQQIGVELGMVWGFLSATLAMVAIGFVAVWSVLSNSLCAIILLMARPFRIGDTIEVIEAVGGSGLKGKLIDISVMYTTINEERPDGSSGLVRIPNNVLVQKTLRVTEGSSSSELKLSTSSNS